MHIKPSWSKSKAYIKNLMDVHLICVSKTLLQSVPYFFLNYKEVCCRSAVPEMFDRHKTAVQGHKKGHCL